MNLRQPARTEIKAKGWEILIFEHARKLNDLIDQVRQAAERGEKANQDKWERVIASYNGLLCEQYADREGTKGPETIALNEASYSISGLGRGQEAHIYTHRGRDREQQLADENELYCCCLASRDMRVSDEEKEMRDRYAGHQTGGYRALLSSRSLN